MSRRADLALAVAELIALVSVAVLPLPSPTIVLLIAASAALWLRGASFGGPPGAGPTPALVGLAVGAIAVVLSAAVAAPILEGASGRVVEWAAQPVAGNPIVLVSAALLAVAGAVAAELAFRGWIAPRLIALNAPVAVAVVGAAIAEAIVTRGSPGARLGALVLGLGTGLLWAGSGRRLGAPIACRIAFELGAVAVAALR